MSVFSRDAYIQTVPNSPLSSSSFKDRHPSETTQIVLDALTNPYLLIFTHDLVVVSQRVSLHVGVRYHNGFITARYLDPDKPNQRASHAMAKKRATLSR